MFGANVVKQSLQRNFTRQLLTLTKSSTNSPNILFSSHESENNIAHKSSLCPFHNNAINCFNRNMATMASSSETEFTNRLSFEKSPYLLQHAKNPVDWYPWSDEAFEKAKKENKLIFLSVGYSTCHWCHVMERESFESIEVAKIMNANYVNIKVDREERPDVDKIYMAFVNRTTGSGGWPMSVFLTPDLEPLFGGTYFPPEDQYGRIGFKKLLQMLADQWKKKHNELNQEAKESLAQLKKSLTKKFVASGSVPNQDSWMKCFQQLTRIYESKYGGFSSAPKFPQPSNLNFLFHLYSKNKSSYEGVTALEMCLYSLTKMANGGIHDHVNSGFARYSVDETWHVPHFEKMLYDQAQLAVAYVDAYVITKEQFYADVVDDILLYVSRDLSHKEGGFYGAEDADSYPTHDSTNKREGAFCVWEYAELQALLTKTTDNLSDFDVYAYHFSVKDGGNVDRKYDHHNELDNKNILSCFGSIEKTAENFKTTPENIKVIIKRCHEILYKVRQERPKPHVDTKIVTAWNGLMISGYARAGFYLNVDKYTDEAVKAANFIRKYLMDEDELLRCCYGDGDAIVETKNPIRAFLEDYAFLIRGLLDLYEATLDSSWLKWAESLQDKQNTVFWDESGHGYFNSAANDSSIIVRDKEDQDGAEPCGNSISVQNLLRLSSYLSRKDLKLKAEKTLSAYSDRLRSIPVVLPEMSSALLFYHSVPTQVFIVGDSDDKDTKALIDVVRQKYMPGRILAVADGPKGRAELLYTRHESLAKLKPVQGKPTAYVCRNFACSLPVTDPEILSENLDTDAKANAVGSSSSSSETENK